MILMKLDMEHEGHKLYKVYINDDPGLTLTYFTGKSNLVCYIFGLNNILFDFKQINNTHIYIQDK